MKKQMREIKAKNEAKVGEKARKPYAAPKLKTHGKIERLTAGSGSPPCYYNSF